MSRNTYAKPTTTNASFMKVPVNLSSTTNATITWGALAAMLPLCVAGGTSPIKAIKLGAITVGGSPEAPAHLEFKGGQTFDLPALATKPMRVKASDKNLYVSGWRRVEVNEQNQVSILSNTDDDNVTNSVVFTYRGQIAYVEVALRFYDDDGYRPWYQGDLPSGPYTTYKMYRNRHMAGGKSYASSWCYVLYFQESNTIVVGEEQYWDSEEQAREWLSAGTRVYGLVEGLFGLVYGGSSSILTEVGKNVSTDTPTTLDGQVMIGPLA